MEFKIRVSSYAHSILRLTSSICSLLRFPFNSCSPMNINHWTDQIDATTAAFIEAFRTLSVEELNWKPDAQTWSVAQNIHHLIVINQTYYPIIKSVRAGTYQLPWIGKINFMVSFFGNTILKSVSPDRKRKMKTFPLWEPSQSQIDEDVLHQFDKHQNGLKELIRSSTDLLEANTLISSPANKNIVYTLKSAFDIIVTHELRHLEQAKVVNEWRTKKVEREK